MQTTSFESHLVAEAQRRREALAAEAPGSEAARRVDPEIASDLAAQGHFTMLAPRELGGGEVSPRTFTQTLYELGRGDPALAWCVMTGSTTSLLTAWLPEAGAREVLGDDGRGILAGIFAPLGRARRVEGGVRLTGRWPFASGCENAAWRMAGEEASEPTEVAELAEDVVEDVEEPPLEVIEETADAELDEDEAETGDPCPDPRGRPRSSRCSSRPRSRRSSTPGT